METRYQSNIELKVLQKEEFLYYFDGQCPDNIILIVFNSRNCIEKIKKEREVEAQQIARFLYEAIANVPIQEKAQIINSYYEKRKLR